MLYGFALPVTGYATIHSSPHDFRTKKKGFCPLRDIQSRVQCWGTRGCQDPGEGIAYCGTLMTQASLMIVRDGSKERAKKKGSPPRDSNRRSRGRQASDLPTEPRARDVSGAFGRVMTHWCKKKLSILFCWTGMKKKMRNFYVPVFTKDKERYTHN